MVAYANNAEGGTNGTGQTAANSGGSSGDAFLDPTLGSGTIIFSNAQKAHGALSYKVSPSGSGNCYTVLDPPGTSTAFAFRGYFYFTGMPSGGFMLAAFRSATGGTHRAGIGIDDAGRCIITDQSEATVYSSATGIVTTNQWYRFECGVVVNSSTGSVDLAVYKDDSMTTELAYTKTGMNTASSGMGWIRIGRVGSTTVAPLYFDDIAYDEGGTTFIGPVSAPPSFGGSFIRVAGGAKARVRQTDGKKASVRITSGGQL